MFLTTTSDKIQVITASAVTVDVQASYADYNTTTVTPARANTLITTATTTDVVGAPAASTYRKVKTLSIRNKHAASSNVTTIQHTDGTNVAELFKVTLTAGETITYSSETGRWEFSPSRVNIPDGGTLGSVLAAYSGATGGAKWVEPVMVNYSTANVATAYATDTYLAGSAISIPVGGVRAGTMYRCRFDMVKTNAGTATPIVTLRIGTAGSTADTARCTWTFAVGTAAIDTGMFEVFAHFRTVGSGTSAVVAGICRLTHALAATGLTTTGAAGNAQFSSVSSGFDSTVANSIIGISFNGGTSFSGTNTVVETETRLLNV